MLMDLGYFGLIVAIIAVGAILTYVVMRAVDHAFRAKESDREYAYEAMLQNDAYTMERFNKRKELEIGYSYNKRLMQGFFDRSKTMSKEMVEYLNKSVWENAKKMMEDM